MTVFILIFLDSHTCFYLAGFLPSIFLLLPIHGFWVIQSDVLLQLSFFANISLWCFWAVTLTIASTPAKFPLWQFQTFVLLVGAISWSHRVNIIVQNINVIVQNSLADSLSCTPFSFSHSVLKLIPIFIFFLAFPLCNLSNNYVK